LAAEGMMGRAKTVRAPRVARSISKEGSKGTPEDEALFESLRALRKELADAKRVPAYIVFSDKVLWEMVARRPSTPGEMMEVPGVGPAKLERYGAAFLDCLDRLPDRDG
jgi:ATP-dependent DNA helicase RecQ